MKFIRAILLVSLLPIFLFTLTTVTRADILLPEYMNAKCLAHEKTVECETGMGFNEVRTSGAYSLLNNNDCLKYANDPSYRNIASDGHGIEKYCLTTANSIFERILINVNHYVLVVVLTLVLELLVYLLAGFREVVKVKHIVLINILTVIGINLLLRYLSYNNFVVVLSLEAIVVIIEASYLYKKIKEKTFGKMLFLSTVANIVSFLLGYIILSSLSF